MFEIPDPRRWPCPTGISRYFVRSAAPKQARPVQRVVYFPTPHASVEILEKLKRRVFNGHKSRDENNNNIFFAYRTCNRVRRKKKPPVPTTGRVNRVTVAATTCSRAHLFRWKKIIIKHVDEKLHFAHEISCTRTWTAYVFIYMNIKKKIINNTRGISI